MPEIERELQEIVVEARRTLIGLPSIASLLMSPFAQWPQEDVDGVNDSPEESADA